MRLHEYLYTDKKGRTRLHFKDELGNKHSISYPRLLMEKHLGRPLNSDEIVHHKDLDPTNNSIDNFEIKTLSDHTRDHMTMYHDKLAICDYCGKEFIWKGKAQSEHYRDMRRKNRQRSGKIFCSKQCCGRYGREVQIKSGLINTRASKK